MLLSDHLAWLGLALLSALSFSAEAADTLLIQLQTDASYRVWYGDGPRHLPDDELLRLAALASREGSEPTETPAGTARAIQQDHAVLIAFADGRDDDRLLLDRDACGGMRVWHTAGRTDLSDNDLTDLVLSALPDGGHRIRLGARYGKAFQTPLGTVAVIWLPGR
jgi:hypothetical protein